MLRTILISKSKHVFRIDIMPGKTICVTMDCSLYLPTQKCKADAIAGEYVSYFALIFTWSNIVE